MLCLAPALLKTGFLAATAGALRLNHAVSFVMPALVAGIHVLLAAIQQQGVDGRDKPGHDEWEQWFNVTGIRSTVPAPRKGRTPARRSTDPDQKSSLLAIGIL